ncbi:MAG: alanine dehydrogenase [Planctomycetota bacterium]|nr:alanine dehydrogenase [Planctomycetota bacterium]
MIIGVPREIKPDENRVGLLPVGAEMLVADGHTVLVQRSAGAGSGFDDKEYAAVGARLVTKPADVYARCELVVKVKEPQPGELRMLHKGQTVFTYFHFAASGDLTRGCLRAGITAVAYETLRDAKGRLPLLTPMSEVAGKMAVQEGAKYLERAMGGRGILLGGVPGVAPASVLVLGGGVVGTNAALVAAGMGARVVLMDVDIDRLRHLAGIMPANVTTIYCDSHAVARHIRYADLVIGAVLIPGARAPRLVRRSHIKTMKPGSVIVDVCIDQGGCVETSHPTTHHDPVFVVDGVIHYCVANMPGAVSRTSSQALCNATLPYVCQLAGRGVDAFAALSPGHAAAINIRAGLITSPAVAGAFPDLPHA